MKMALFCRKDEAQMYYTLLLNVWILFLLVYSESANELYVQVISNGAIRMRSGWTGYRLARY